MHKVSESSNSRNRLTVQVPAACTEMLSSSAKNRRCVWFHSEGDENVIRTLFALQGHQAPPERPATPEHQAFPAHPAPQERPATPECQALPAPLELQAPRPLQGHPARQALLPHPAVEGHRQVLHEDQDVRPEFFALGNSRDAALFRYEQISGNWNAHLYAKIRTNYKGCEVPDAKPEAVADDLPGGCMTISDYIAEMEKDPEEKARLDAVRQRNRRMLADYSSSVTDSDRLDYIERTFSGMTNLERYLPVQMHWGKSANGRTLREACDKYMRRDAAQGDGRG